MMAMKQRPALRPPVMAPKTQSAGGPAKPYQAPSRAGKRGVTFYLEPEKWKRLRKLSVDAEATIQDLMEEAVGMLLDEHRSDSSRS